MTKLTSFTLFRKLPVEIQQLIWTFACYDLRCSTVIINRNIAENEDLPHRRQKLAFQTESRRVPPLLHATFQARHVGLRIYRLLSFTSTEIYHNPEADSIRFEDDPYNNHLLMMSLANQSHVQHIICNSFLWLQEDKFNGLRRFFDVLCRYRNLKKITWLYGRRRFPKQLAREIKQSFEMDARRRIGWRVPKLAFQGSTATKRIILSPF
jgi:hypothetical protein